MKKHRQLLQAGRRTGSTGRHHRIALVHCIFGENPYELKEIINRWMLGKNDQLKELLKKSGQGIELPLIPTDSIVMKVDKEAVRRCGMKIPEADSHPRIYAHLAERQPKRALYKSELMMLEMLANANWERPIYMAITVGSENHLAWVTTSFRKVLPTVSLRSIRTN